MQLEQLRYVVTIAYHNNISRAAKELNISQSALSQSMIKLENELGIKIFHRYRDGVSLTSKGKQIVKLATSALKKVEQLNEFALQNPDIIMDNLDIGIIYGLHLPFVPSTISNFKKKYPNCKPNLHELSSKTIVQALLNFEIDLGILAIYEETITMSERITFIPIKKVNMYVFMSKDSHLSSKTVIYPKDLQNETFIIFNGEFMNWFYKKYTEQYYEIDVLLKTRNNETISETVINNLAIAIEVEQEIHNNPYIKSGEMVAKRLVLNEIFNENYLGIAYLKNKQFSPTSFEFIRTLENELKKIK